MREIMQSSRLFAIFIVFTLSLMPLVPAPAQSAAPAAGTAGTMRVEGIRYGENGGKSRIVIDLNRSSPYRVFMLADPARLIVDLPRAEWRTQRAHPSITGPVLKSYRSGELDGNLTRIVFDLARPAVIDNAFTLPREESAKDRVVIDLSPSSENLFRARLGAVFGDKDIRGAGATGAAATSALADARSRDIAATTAAAVPSRKPETPRTPSKYVVVLDAGHGGNDPGAVAQNVYEKNITLATVKELRRQLEETGRYRVVLTRPRSGMNLSLSRVEKKRTCSFPSMRTRSAARTCAARRSIRCRAMPRTWKRRVLPNRKTTPASWRASTLRRRARMWRASCWISPCGRR